MNTLNGGRIGIASQALGIANGAYELALQYSNERNWQAHYHGTAMEILEQTNGNLTHFVGGIGTGGGN